MQRRKTNAQDPNWKVKEKVNNKSRNTQNPLEKVKSHYKRMDTWTKYVDTRNVDTLRLFLVNGFSMQFPRC